MKINISIIYNHLLLIAQNKLMAIQCDYKIDSNVSHFLI